MSRFTTMSALTVAAALAAPVVLANVAVAAHDAGHDRVVQAGCLGPCGGGLLPPMVL